MQSTGRVLKKSGKEGGFESMVGGREEAGEGEEGEVCLLCFSSEIKVNNKFFLSPEKKGTRTETHRYVDPLPTNNENGEGRSPRKRVSSLVLSNDFSPPSSLLPPSSKRHSLFSKRFL